jgi:hypothetical protein
MGFKKRTVPKLKVNHRRAPKKSKKGNSVRDMIAEPLGTPPPKPKSLKNWVTPHSE